MIRVYGWGAAALLLILAHSACDRPAAPSSQPVVDLSGVWRGTDASLGGFSQTVIWTISQTGDAFSGTWNNGEVPPGTVISGQVSGTFDRTGQRMTFSMTWMPSSPNPYWVCAGFYQDPLVTRGAGPITREGRATAMSVAYGNWTGCNGTSLSLPSGQLTLVRQ
jgi:hypothetical protein